MFWNESITGNVRERLGVQMSSEFDEGVEDARGRQAVEESFHNRASKALKEAGFTPLQFLAANPGLSDVDLAKALNRGASAYGLTMAIYDEAERKCVVRDIAKDMLIRLILAKFPNGWTTKDKIRPFVKLSTWSRMLSKHVLDPRVGVFANLVSKVLTQLDQPPEGWRPGYPTDQRIDELFDKYWPVEPASTE